MNARKIAMKELKQEHFLFKRSGANHDIYYNEELGAMIPLKRHDFDEDDLKYIRKEIKQYKSKNKKEGQG